ncbi:hypothetical protein AMS59_22935 [Lysinibacillus sp. FJAT-14745]|uniref:hypothetical protein n=1 Tax=Lysinibacillus sp. FJAT-14745 TaxID=1704289 RepID=UPI0006AB9831|nr:hypothetical protein [Lysinibacillus sp. FJAT-14745]KOP69765.1 hypothetical protein AMS59_22935 [Lysinibacillus sp. FJAT-14745]
MVSMEDMSIRLTILRGAYGYKGFTEQVGENLYKVDTKAFKETIENAKEPIDASKVSELSSNQIKMLQGAPSGSWLVPLLNRMGQLGMMDLREGLVNPKLFQYTSTMNAYKRSI